MNVLILMRSIYSIAPNADIIFELEEGNSLEYNLIIIYLAIAYKSQTKSYRMIINFIRNYYVVMYLLEQVCTLLFLVGYRILLLSILSK